ncbi:MAG: metallophosphoesterase family protein [Planctomycetes bacterium]|nr:metallophosphoesterase family protein [Planctomycetota bacterium]
MSVRYAILSDIHGNLPALRAVLRHLETQRIDAYVCLGDIVGYGAQPSECLYEIRKYCQHILAGNHDFAAVERIPMGSFNALAREAILWTRLNLSDDELQYLSGLPLQARGPGFHLVHSALYAPELFDYVQSSYDAHLTMECMVDAVCFVGHSHIPVMFLEGEAISYSLATEIRVDPERRVIVNVGSVGQPRDRDPRASFGIYDTQAQTVRLVRARYEVDEAAARIRDAGLPPQLGARLKFGL